MDRDIAAHPFTDADICKIQYHATSYGHMRKVLLKAFSSLAVPRVYVADPPPVDDPHLEDMWLYSFDLKVTELANKKVSVIEPSLIRSVLHHGPANCRTMIASPDPFIQDFLNEGLLDIVFLPRTQAENGYYKHLREVITQAQERSELDHTTGLPLYEYPPHYIQINSYPLVGLDQIIKGSRRRSP